MQKRFPLASTYSIVARDPETGQFGVAVQSHWFSVGPIVAFAEAGVGAVATQSMVESSYGPLGLELMRAKVSAQAALNALLSTDEGEAVRQVAMVDSQGGAAAHTGGRCIRQAGHVKGDGFSVQANMMASVDVWPAMESAYRYASGDFAERLLAALDAAEAAGGDIRGKQSSHILIVAAESTGRPWADKIIDLRVEDHPEPLQELRRLVRLQSAYTFMNKGDEMMVEDKGKEALDAYSKAAEVAPEIAEIPFWHAVTLADIGKLDDALPIFKRVFSSDPNLAILVQDLPKSALLRDDPEMMREILSMLE
jgi:uncharacterized Ntn-hydrolase superfamily protein